MDMLHSIGDMLRSNRTEHVRRKVQGLQMWNMLQTFGKVFYSRVNNVILAQIQRREVWNVL